VSVEEIQQVLDQCQRVLQQALSYLVMPQDVEARMAKSAIIGVIPVIEKQRRALAASSQSPSPSDDTRAITVPLRIIELAERLCQPGLKASGVSASEMMEITEWIFETADAAMSSPSPAPKEGA